MLMDLNDVIKHTMAEIVMFYYQMVAESALNKELCIHLTYRVFFIQLIHNY